MSGLFDSPQQQFTIPPIPAYLQNYLTAAANYLTGQIGLPTGMLQNLALGNLAANQQAAQGLTGPGVTAASKIISGGTLDPTQNPWVQKITGAISGVTNTQLQQLIADANQRFAAMGLGTSSPLLDVTGRIASQVLPAEATQIGNVLMNAYLGNLGQQTSVLPYALGLPSTTAQGLFNTLQATQYAPVQAGGGLSQASLQAPQPSSYGPPPILNLLGGLGALYGGGTGKGGGA